MPKGLISPLPESVDGHCDNIQLGRLLVPQPLLTKIPTVWKTTKKKAPAEADVPVPVTTTRPKRNVPVKVDVQTKRKHRCRRFLLLSSPIDRVPLQIRRYLFQTPLFKSQNPPSQFQSQSRLLFPILSQVRSGPNLNRLLRVLPMKTSSHIAITDQPCPTLRLSTPRTPRFPLR